MPNSRSDNWFRETDLAVGSARSGRVLDCGHCEPAPPPVIIPPNIVALVSVTSPGSWYVGDTRTVTVTVDAPVTIEPLAIEFSYLGGGSGTFTVTIPVGATTGAGTTIQQQAINNVVVIEAANPRLSNPALGHTLPAGIPYSITTLVPSPASVAVGVQTTYTATLNHVNNTGVPIQFPVSIGSTAPVTFVFAPGGTTATAPISFAAAGTVSTAAQGGLTTPAAPTVMWVAPTITPLVVT